MKCLVIDDDFDSRRLLQKILRPFACVDVATDGEEGVLAFHQALKENEPYQLITLDLVMPNSDGQQALREIREIEREMGIAQKDGVKIIVVSGLDDNREIHDAFFLGNATSYMMKPVRRQILLEEVENLGLTLNERGNA